MSCIFHIDMDAFFVSVERARDESLWGKPVAVGGRGVRGVVASASYEARAYGIMAGMSLSQARRLCPEAVFLEGRFGHYQEVSRRLIDLLYRFTPDVEVSGIDEAYLDMTGFELLYGNPLTTARRLKEQIQEELRVTASVGIASSKLVAKVASDFYKPDGLCLVPSGEESAFLAPLPVAHLPGVGPQTEKALASLGVETIGQLALLPFPLLRRLFGRSGLTLYHHAQGLDNSPVEPPAEAKSISRSTTFERDTLDLAFLEAILGYLTERVGAELVVGCELRMLAA
ncbi:MAG: DNA polymerase IV, partial [Chloroflexota bacterium]